jgi:hypothetical protein
MSINTIKNQGVVVHQVNAVIPSNANSNVYIDRRILEYQNEFYVIYGYYHNHINQCFGEVLSEPFTNLQNAINLYDLIA